MSTRNKILLTIFLAVVASWLLGCGTGEPETITPPTPDRFVSVSYLENSYKLFNSAYFDNKLHKSPIISMDEENQDFMATTLCTEDGSDCVIKINRRYVTAARVADLTMLHEMCHVKVWARERDLLGEGQHGPTWRACMLQLDMQGAFRNILIDNYWLEQVP